MLRFTGHPLLDVGVAAITAFSNKDSPEQVTEADMETMADYMADNYVVDPLHSFFYEVFLNSGYTQASYKKQPEKRKIYIDRVLHSFRNEVPKLNKKDVFFGLPVAAVHFDVKNKLAPGRVFRQHIPLLTGEDVINFHPYGDSGIPVSGLALFAFQALPMGCAKCSGKLFAVHSDNTEIMLYFAAQFLTFNRRAVTLAQQAGEKKMAEPHLKHRTLLIKYLIDAINFQNDIKNFEEPFTVTAYHFSNGKKAYIEIYHLPSQFVLYLREMLSADYSKEWQKIVGRAWELPKLKRGQKETSPDFRPGRNWLYEDLFQLAGNVTQYAARFIRIYFLREALSYARDDAADPRGDYSLQREASLVSWKPVESFLRRIVNMQKDRIEHIRAMGDSLADYVSQQNDKRFFRNFYVENRYGNFRNILIKANTEHVRRGNAPFLTFDIFIAVFEDGEELARVDWRLARDLVLIRMVEQLYANGWLGNNPEALPEKEESEEQVEQSLE